MKEFVSNDLKLLQAKKNSLLTRNTYNFLNKVDISCGEAIMKQKEKENFSKRLNIEYGNI